MSYKLDDLWASVTNNKGTTALTEKTLNTIMNNTYSNMIQVHSFTLYSMATYPSGAFPSGVSMAMEYDDFLSKKEEEEPIKVPTLEDFLKGIDK